MNRKGGILYTTVICNNRKSKEIPIYFSFKVKAKEGNRIWAGDFVPSKVMKLLEKREFLILRENLNGHFIKGKIKKVDNGLYLIETQDNFIEKRTYDRFSFCPEELGRFQLQRDSQNISKGVILDISVSGIKFLSEKPVNLKIGEVLTLSQKDKSLQVQIIRIEDVKIFGMKIICTNFNLMKLLVTAYVNLIKKIL